jgi:hypothetical protein
MIDLEIDELKKWPEDGALCCAMRHGLMKLHITGREVDSLRTEDSVTTTMSSWPYNIWMTARGESIMMDKDLDLFHQDFVLSIKTVNEHAKMALENVPFNNCSRCSKQYAGRLCIFHTIPPQEFIRCFCLAHPDIRGPDCLIHPGPGNSECPSHCPNWELAKGEMRSFPPLYAKSDSAIDGAYTCVAEMIFRRRKSHLGIK